MPNRKQLQPVVQSVFSSTVLNTAAVDLPTGVSPDSQDVIMDPGSVETRPGLHKNYSSPIELSTSLTYEKTFVQGSGNPLNLFLTSSGKFFQEDVTNTPGTLTNFGMTFPGLYASSITVDSVEYIAVHDNIHGQDIPRQWDGVNFDRISQDGVAGTPTVTDTFYNTNVANAQLNFITSISATGFNNGVGEIITATPHGLVAGQVFCALDTVDPAFSGGFTVLAVLAPDHFTFNCGTPATTGGGGSLYLGYFTVVTAGGFINNVGDAVTLNATMGFDGAGTPANPQQFTIVNVPDTFTFGLSLLGTALKSATGVGGSGGTARIGGRFSPGAHQLSTFFITRTGYFTKPCPPTTWISSGGKAVITNIPIGPGNVVARGFCLTTAGSTAMSFLDVASNSPVSTPGYGIGIPPQSPSIFTAATILPNNTDTTFTLDISDATLGLAERVDVPGNNLFNYEVLGPVSGLAFYASRLFAFGERNKVQNFVNMGFEGGTATVGGTLPLGWTNDVAGGALVASPDFGLAWQITGDGTNTTKGRLYQTAYQDYLFQPILFPNIQYYFRGLAKHGAGPSTGNLVVELFAGSIGFSSTVVFPVTSLSAGARGAFVEGTFTALPGIVPSDLQLRVYGTNLGSGTTVIVDELEIIPVKQPFTNAFARASELNNFEAFDGEFGRVGFGQLDGQTISGLFQIRDSLYCVKSESMFQTNDNSSTEPAGWTVTTQSTVVGAANVRSWDLGEGYAVLVNRKGGFIFEGGDPFKFTEVFQPRFDSINKSALSSIWVKNDIENRRIYIAEPQGTATAPSEIIVADYQMLDSGSQIVSAKPIHTTYAGKLIASDLVVKFTTWNVRADCCNYIAQPGGNSQLMFGSGDGNTPGVGTAFGNVYYLDPAKLTDDDYGRIFSYYVTGPIVDSEASMELGILGIGLLTNTSVYVSGVGNIQLTPYVNELSNPQRPTALVQLNTAPAGDIMFRHNTSGERIFMKVQPQPLPGHTDCSFKLRKMVYRVITHPFLPGRRGV